jgi:hypothetical protein
MSTLPCILAALGFVLPASAFAKVETWRLDSPSAFAKAKRERVIVSDLGHVRLGRAVLPTAPLDAVHVWDLVRTKSGTFYAATGNAGRVYRRENNGPWTVSYDAADTQALALVALLDGRVFAGTGPTGQVIELTDPKHPASRPDKDVLYIWDLAADGDGNLYAATGPTGQLWKRSPSGAWSLLLDSKHPHLLCVTVGPDGSVYAGSDGEGLVYRVTPGGKVSVVYDATQSEIRTLSIGPDGALYAGTAVEAGGGSAPGGPARGLASLPGRDAPDAPKAIETVSVALTPQGLAQGRPAAEPPGGTASPRPISPGDNAVYRIGPDGAVREIFRARVLIFALAWQGDRLLAGTGPEGQLFEIQDLGRESAPIARLDHGQVLSLLTDDKGRLLIGAGDPGSVLLLAPEFSASGTLTSEVHDAKLISRFGAVQWRADVPAGTSVGLQVRSGNVGEPDATWSDWSPLQTDPATAKANAPPARFVQFRVTLKTSDPAESPELHSIVLHYQTVNLAPELSKIDVPDVSAGDGATRQSKLNIRWEGSDPNGDDLQYTLHIRKESWPDWVKLGEEPLTERTYAWDTSAVPGGVYRLRVSATDRPSNSPEEALTRELTSDPFIIDHQPPAVTISFNGKTATVTLKDDLTRLAKAAYAVDGGDWIAAFPDDGLFDTSSETITISFANLKSGAHVLMVRGIDAAGNVGTGDVVVKGPE